MTTKDVGEDLLGKADIDHEGAAGNLFDSAYKDVNGKLPKFNLDSGIAPDVLPPAEDFFVSVKAPGAQGGEKKEGPYSSPDGKMRGYHSKNLDGTILVWHVTENTGFHNPVAGIQLAPDGKPTLHLRRPDDQWKDNEIKLASAVIDGSNIKMTRPDGGQIFVDMNSGKVVNETCTPQERESIRNDLLSGKSVDDLKANHPGLQSKADGSVFIGSGTDEHVVFRPEWRKEAHQATGDAKGPARRWNDTVGDEFFRTGTFNNDQAGLAKTIAQAQKELSKDEFKEFMGYIKEATKPYIKLDRGDDPLSKITIGKYQVEKGEVLEAHRSSPSFESTESRIKNTDKGVQITDARGATWDVTLNPGTKLPVTDVQDAVMRNKEGKEIAKVNVVDGKLTYDYKGADGKWQETPIALKNAECKADGTLVMHAEDGRTFERNANGGLVHRDKDGRPELVEDANCNVYRYNWSKIPDGIPVTTDSQQLKQWLQSHPYQVTKVGPDTGWVEQIYSSKGISEIALDKLWNDLGNVLGTNNLNFQKRCQDLFAASDKYTVKMGDKCQPSTTAVGAAVGFTPPSTPVQFTVGVAKPTQADVSLNLDPKTLDLSIQGQRATTNEDVRGEDTEVIYRLDGTRTIITKKKEWMKKPEVVQEEIDRNGQKKSTNGAPQQ